MNRPDKVTLHGKEVSGMDLEVVAINDHGDVAGEVSTGEQVLGEDYAEEGYGYQTWSAPVLWPAGSSDPIVWELDEDASSFVMGLTEDGTVIGSQGTSVVDYYAGDDDTDWENWLWTVGDDDGESLPGTPIDGDYGAVSDVRGDWVLSGNTRFNVDDQDEGEIDSAMTANAIDGNGTVYGHYGDDMTPARMDRDVVIELPGIETEEFVDGDITDASMDGSVLIGWVATERGMGGAAFGKEHPAIWTCG